MEDITELENLNMAKENIETEAIANSDHVILVAGEPLESGRAVVVNSSGQVMHATPNADAIDILSQVTHEGSTILINGNVLIVLSIDELGSDEISRVTRPSRGSRGFCQARIESAERTAEFISERDNMSLIEEFSTRRFPQARRDEWERAVQSLKPPKPIACVGCINYHGQSYGGNKLICAIHPTGVEGDNCGDWEGEFQSL